MTTLYIKHTLLLVILVALTVTSCNVRSPAPQSGVYISDPEKQLDPLLLHEVRSLHVSSAQATYQIINTTNNTCSIIFEGASCGCTIVEVDGKPLQLKESFTLAAGDSANLKLMSRLPFNPGSFDFRAALTAVSVEGAQKEISVHCSVKVLADLVLTPDVLAHDFHALDEQSVTKPIHVERRWRGKLVPSSIPIMGNLPPQLKIHQIVEENQPTQIEPGIWSRSWKMMVSLTPSSDLQSNPIRSLMPIDFSATADFDSISADLPVLIRLASGIEAPNSSHFGSIQLGGKQARRIILRAADNVEFSVLKIHSTSPAFSVSKPSSTHGRTCWLELTFRPKAPGNHRANIVIETNHPKSRQVIVSVCGIGFEKDNKTKKEPLPD